MLCSVSSMRSYAESPTTKEIPVETFPGYAAPPTVNMILAYNVGEKQ